MEKSREYDVHGFAGEDSTDMRRLQSFVIQLALFIALIFLFFQAVRALKGWLF